MCTLYIGSINDTTPKRGLRSFCVCQWFLSCFRRDETTPVNTIHNDSSENPIVSNEYVHDSSYNKCTIVSLCIPFLLTSMRANYYYYYYYYRYLMVMHYYLL